MQGDSDGTLAHAEPDRDIGGAVPLERDLLHDGALAIRQACEHALRIDAVARLDLDRKLGRVRPVIDVDMVVNTPTGVGARTDGWEIRRAAVSHGIPCLTTLAAGISAARAIASAQRDGEGEVLCLQELHGGARRPSGSAPAGRDGAGVA